MPRESPSTLCRRRGPEGIYKIRALDLGCAWGLLRQGGRAYTYVTAALPGGPRLCPMDLCSLCIMRVRQDEKDGICVLTSVSGWSSRQKPFEPCWLHGSSLTSSAHAQQQPPPVSRSQQRIYFTHNPHGIQCVKGHLIHEPFHLLLVSSHLLLVSSHLLHLLLDWGPRA